jgi:hypothetical protein
MIYIKDFGYGFLRIPQDRLTHVQLLFTWNPSPHWSSRISLEYLLLPPRSASVTAPGGLTSDPFDAITVSLLLVEVYIVRLLQRQSIGSTLQHHPFSGLVASAGELLHTP